MRAPKPAAGTKAWNSDMGESLPKRLRLGCRHSSSFELEPPIQHLQAGIDLDRITLAVNNVIGDSMSVVVASKWWKLLSLAILCAGCSSQPPAADCSDR